MQPTEIWLPIPGHPGYEASSLGRIRSLDRYTTTKNGHRRWYPGRIRALARKPDGYLFVSLPGPTVVTVHRLVCLAFYGLPGPGQEVRHLNDIPLDNRPENLAWGTSAENSRDCVLNGHHRLASQTACLRGHEFTPENTYISDAGGHRSRVCRTCRRDTARARYAANLDASRARAAENSRAYRARKRARKAPMK